MNIEQVTQYDAGLLRDINTLIAQLSGSASPLTAVQLRALLDAQHGVLLVARDGERIGAMLTLVVFRIPTGLRAWVEDVVVGESDRGKGIGRELLAAAVEQARARGAKTLDLTSRPTREAANRLYRSAGFVQRSTNVYRLEL